MHYAGSSCLVHSFVIFFRSERTLGDTHNFSWGFEYLTEMSTSYRVTPPHLPSLIPSSGDLLPAQGEHFTDSAPSLGPFVLIWSCVARGFAWVVELFVIRIYKIIFSHFVHLDSWKIREERPSDHAWNCSALLILRGHHPFPLCPCPLLRNPWLYKVLEWQNEWVRNIKERNDDAY